MSVKFPEKPECSEKREFLTTENGFTQIGRCEGKALKKLEKVCAHSAKCAQEEWALKAGSHKLLWQGNRRFESFRRVGTALF